MQAALRRAAHGMARLVRSLVVPPTATSSSQTVTAARRVLVRFEVDVRDIALILPPVRVNFDEVCDVIFLRVRVSRVHAMPCQHDSVHV